VDFLEGKQNEILIKASVPAPGKPVISVQDLPAGANFSPETMKLTWTPSFDAANEAKDFSVVMKPYVVKFYLTSSEDPLTVAKRSITLIVKDVPRKFELTTASQNAEIEEGQEAVQHRPRHVTRKGVS
jgi:hypothetical protein